MLRKLRVLMCLLVTLILLPSGVALAEESTISSDTTPTISADGIVQPNVMFIRKFVRYDQSYVSINYTYSLMGQVTINNINNSTTVNLQYQNTTSNTINASISGTTNTSVEATALFAKVSASVGFTVGASRSWSSGTMTSCILPVSPGNFGKIKGYCPGSTTSGGFVYKVYNLDYPDNYWYETTPVSNAQAPSTNYIHYVTEQHPYVF